MLINAVASGVGLAGLQLARAWGAAAYGTTRSLEKLTRAKALGLSDGIVVGDGLEPLDAAVKRWTNGRGIDVTLELVGGPYVLASIRAAAPKGRVILVGTMAGANAEIPLGTVLRKRLNKVPVTPPHGATVEEGRRCLVQEMTAWLFSPNGADRGLVELTFAGSTTPVLRYRRDLLTGALVDRAVQEAARAALRDGLRTGERGGITLELLARAFDNQLRAIGDQLTEMNARQYVDLPDGVRVATLRRVPQPAWLPHELQRS